MAHRPRSAERFADTVRSASTMFWNGPTGVFEQDRFAAGTTAVAQAVAARYGYSVVRGGETFSALSQLDLAMRIDYLSAGGGASLELVADADLPAMRALREGARS